MPKLSTKVEGSHLPTKDQTFNDDVIVDGSLCVGVDCADGEVFGFDTIPMMENLSTPSS